MVGERFATCPSITYWWPEICNISSKGYCWPEVCNFSQQKLFLTRGIETFSSKSQWGQARGLQLFTAKAIVGLKFAKFPNKCYCWSEVCHISQQKQVLARDLQHFHAKAIDGQRFATIPSKGYSSVAQSFATFLWKSYTVVWDLFPVVTCGQVPVRQSYLWPEFATYHSKSYR